MDYLSFDPSSCNFPKPRVPVLPRLTRQALGRAQADGWPLLGEHASVRHFSRGRYALAQACRLAGLAPGTALLAPAYHCRTMLDPALRLGAQVLLYPLRPDLTPDLDRLAGLLAAPPAPVKAVLATHFFGFAQPQLAELSGLCQRHGTLLIEDCSHAMFGRLGKTGQFAAASPYKFFPSPDGGMLWSNGGAPLPDEQKRPAALLEAKAVWGSLQPRPGDALDTATLAADTDTAAALAAAAGQQVRHSHGGASAQYDVAEELGRGLAWSRWIMRHTDHQRLVTRRRDNYRRWLAAVEGLPHGRALQAKLGEEVVPYMFPLLIDHPQSHFYLLKRLGVPVWRWDDMAASDCAVATAYRLRLLHLPCHQELTERQMSWMIAAVQHVLRRDPIATT